MADAAADNSTARRLEIRKYPNRRYYDTTRSRHVTLEEIYNLIRDGYEVQVIDSKSGQDITPKVLAQIIIELDPPKLGVFPVPLLHRLLRSNEQLVVDFISKYFNQPLMAFLDSQRSFEQHLRQMMGLQSPTPTVADWAKIMWGSLDPSVWAGGRPRGGENGNASSAPGGGEGGDEKLRALVNELQAQVAELQEQLGSKKKKTS